MKALTFYYLLLFKRLLYYSYYNSNRFLIRRPDMIVNGIIAEYNPFHNGHIAHLEKTKEQTGADYTIVAMSGNFVQRGAPAVIDKYVRTKMALEGGADAFDGVGDERNTHLLLHLKCRVFCKRRCCSFGQARCRRLPFFRKWIRRYRDLKSHRINSSRRAPWVFRIYAKILKRGLYLSSCKKQCPHPIWELFVWCNKGTWVPQ